jgi:hypothetical protein
MAQKDKEFIYVNLPGEFQYVPLYIEFKKGVYYPLSEVMRVLEFENRKTASRHLENVPAIKRGRKTYYRGGDMIDYMDGKYDPRTPAKESAEEPAAKPKTSRRK